MILRTLKLVISLAFCACDWMASRLRILIGLKSHPSCVVLYYHAIEPSQTASFARQMEELVRWTKPISATHSGSFSDGSHYAAVTFDDGFVSVIENALPSLESRDIPSLIFVPTGSLGRQPAWIKQPKSAWTPGNRHDCRATARFEGPLAGDDWFAFRKPPELPEA